VRVLATQQSPGFIMQAISDPTPIEPFELCATDEFGHALRARERPELAGESEHALCRAKILRANFGADTVLAGAVVPVWVADGKRNVCELLQCLLFWSLCICWNDFDTLLVEHRFRN
jgi:hypothetical protein